MMTKRNPIVNVNGKSGEEMMTKRIVAVNGKSGEEMMTKRIVAVNGKTGEEMMSKRQLEGMIRALGFTLIRLTFADLGDIASLLGGNTAGGAGDDLLAGLDLDLPIKKRQDLDDLTSLLGGGQAGGDDLLAGLGLDLPIKKRQSEY